MTFEIADDHSYCSAEISGKVVATAEALSGPMTPQVKRVQTINSPGSVAARSCYNMGYCYFRPSGCNGL